MKGKCRQAKANPPSILCIQEFDFQNSNKWRKDSRGTVETDRDSTSMLNSGYMFGSLWLTLLIKYRWKFRWPPIVHTVPLVPPSCQTKRATIKQQTHEKVYNNTNGPSFSVRRASVHVISQETVKLECCRAVAQKQRLANSSFINIYQYVRAMFFSELIPGQWITSCEIAKEIKSFISRCNKKKKQEQKLGPLYEIQNVFFQ